MLFETLARSSVFHLYAHIAIMAPMYVCMLCLCRTFVCARVRIARELFTRTHTHTYIYILYLEETGVKPEVSGSSSGAGLFRARSRENPIKTWEESGRGGKERGSKIEWLIREMFPTTKCRVRANWLHWFRCRCERNVSIIESREMSQLIFTMIIIIVVQVSPVSDREMI